MKLKIVCFSDTHGFHNYLKLQKGNVLLFAGDLSNVGRLMEIKNFIDWFSSQPHQYKVFIAGNHDFGFENFIKEDVLKLIPDNITYLNDSGVSIDGFNFWGSPVSPRFHNWAFNRDENIQNHWDLIPNNTDVLITHTPPYGILDLTQEGLNVGCRRLRDKILEIQPKLNVFGHIHEAYGEDILLNTKCINASVLNRQYQVVNKPIIFNLNKK